MSASSTIVFDRGITGGSYPEHEDAVAAYVFHDTANPTASASDYVATFDWGDGTVYSTADPPPDDGYTDLTCNPEGQCVLSVGGHAYADEGSYPLTVTVFPAGDTASSPSAATLTGSFTITDADTLTAGTAIPLHLDNTHAFSGTVATFSDTGYPSNDPSDFTASIVWGDSSSSQGTVTSDGKGTFTVSGSHTYPGNGPYTVAVTLADDDPGTATATATTTAGAITFLVITTGDINENQFVGGLAAEFSDGATSTPSASDYAATFDWGDGTVYSTADGTASITCNVPTAGQCQLSVNGHTYVDEGSYTVTATVYPAGGSPTGSTAFSDVGTLAAQEADTLQPGDAATIQVTEGQQFSGPVATFSDAGYPTNSPSDFTASIDWGDGTTASGEVTSDGAGTLTVSGKHTYATSNTYTVSVSLADDAPGTASASASGTADVAEAPINWVSSPTVTTTEGHAFTDQTLATFTDTVDNSSCATTTYTANIVWNDGSADSAGTVSVSGCTLTVTGSHTYLESGSKAPTVQLFANGTLASSHAGAVTVNEADLTVSGTGTIDVPVLTSTAPFTAATFTDTAANSTVCSADTYSYSITYNGVATATGTVSGTSSCTGTVTDSHTFALPGSYTICTTVKDDDANTSFSTCGTTVVVGYPTSSAPSTINQRATAGPALSTPLAFRQLSISVNQASLTAFSGGIASYVDTAAGIRLTDCSVGSSPSQCRLTIASITRSACGGAGTTETIYGTYTLAGSTTPLQLKVTLVAGAGGTGSVHVTLERADGSIYTGPLLHATVTVTC